MANPNIITPGAFQTTAAPNSVAEINFPLFRQDLDRAMSLLMCASMACRDLMDSEPIKEAIDETSERLWALSRTLCEAPVQAGSLQ